MKDGIILTKSELKQMWQSLEKMDPAEDAKDGWNNEEFINSSNTTLINLLEMKQKVEHSIWAIKNKNRSKFKLYS